MELIAKTRDYRYKKKPHKKHNSDIKKIDYVGSNSKTAKEIITLDNRKTTIIELGVFQSLSIFYCFVLYRMEILLKIPFKISIQGSGVGVMSYSSDGWQPWWP